MLAPHLALGRTKASLLLGAWVCALLGWLYFAWNVEIQGRNMYLALWFASVAMFATNIVALNVCIRAYCSHKVGADNVDDG